MAGDTPRRPFVEYADDKKDPDNYVRICVDIKGLKKKTLGGGPSNADISLKLEERSFSITVALRSGGRTENYEYAVKQLPEAISTDPKKSKWKMKRDEEVIVLLHKVKPESWTRYLSSVGLETAPDTEAEGT